MRARCWETSDWLIPIELDRSPTDRSSIFNSHRIISRWGCPRSFIISLARCTTQGYLRFLSHRIEGIIEKDGDLADAYAIDQSDYAHLNTFQELAAKNVGRLFQTMEMEFF